MSRNSFHPQRCSHCGGSPFRDDYFDVMGIVFITGSEVKCINCGRPIPDPNFNPSSSKPGSIVDLSNNKTRVTKEIDA